jgi:hypothetical protein
MNKKACWGSRQNDCDVAEACIGAVSNGETPFSFRCYVFVFF